MSSQYTAQPYHTDDFGGRHYPPQPEVPPSTTHPRYPRPTNPSDKYDRRPRRAHTYRTPRPPPPSTSNSSTSPPPRRSPRNHHHNPPKPSPHDPRPRRHREDDYFSDTRHDRRHPRSSGTRHSGRDRDRDVREKDRVEPRRSTRPRAERQESKWQKEGKRFFNEYAVPAIKAEGTKYISKQIGNIIAKGVSS